MSLEKEFQEIQETIAGLDDIKVPEPADNFLYYDALSRSIALQELKMSAKEAYYADAFFTAGTDDYDKGRSYMGCDQTDIVAEMAGFPDLAQRICLAKAEALHKKCDYAYYDLRDVKAFIEAQALDKAREIFVLKHERHIQEPPSQSGNIFDFIIAAKALGLEDVLSVCIAKAEQTFGDTMIMIAEHLEKVGIDANRQWQVVYEQGPMKEVGAAKLGLLKEAAEMARERIAEYRQNERYAALAQLYEKIKQPEQARTAWILYIAGDFKECPALAIHAVVKVRKFQAAAEMTKLWAEDSEYADAKTGRYRLTAKLYELVGKPGPADYSEVETLSNPNFRQMTREEGFQLQQCLLASRD